MNISTVIFDLDGTVVDDEKQWGRAFAKVLRSLGAKNVSSMPHIRGIGIEENWPILLKKYNLSTNKGKYELASETKGEYIKLISTITLKKGFKKFIKDLKMDGINTALATSSTWEVVEKLFDRFGIEKDFDVVITGEEVSYKKPDPQIFEIVLDKLGVSPNECIVFEDSSAGIIAAKKLGIKTVGIYQDENHKKRLKNADMLVKDFSRLNYKILSNLSLKIYA